ncbi:MAG: type I-E CRISPR-associated protein Cse1/CasA [Candidatus Methanoperedens sp.]|nr:type I-E CRISPR-associated protein Cse1/CasA [Candidatus Methanoperedens sp.]
MIDEKWIPVRRADGKNEIIAPWQVTDNIGSNPIVSLDANRPDFNGALIQFLIGLVQTTVAPKKDKNWRTGFAEPPSTGELKAAFEKVSHAFNLDGDSPRFMQDFEPGEWENNQIDKLLVEIPGNETIKDNADHFIKRDSVKRMCFACSAMSLFTLQTNAPSGGRGHRVSLRGGGPLTTIVMGYTLWQTIWLNVLNESDFVDKYGNSSLTDDASIFPWMGPTRTSEKNQLTTPEDAHPAQMFWGMPRRIFLDFNSDETGNCDVCDCDSNNLVTNYVAKSYGTNYEGGWRHTLTPYRRVKNELISIKGQPGGITFRHWLGLVQNDMKKGGEPATVVHTFRGRHEGLENKKPLQLWAFGYDFDNMKVRCWYEGKMPLINVDDSIREYYESVIEQLIRVSELVSDNVRKYVKEAMFRRPGDVKGDFSFIDNRFWNNTEAEFYATLEKLRIAFSDDTDIIVDIKLQWLNTLFRIGEQLFDEYSQSNQIDVADPRRIALAYRNLRKFNQKNNKQIIKILDLPVKTTKVIN